VNHGQQWFRIVGRRCIAVSAWTRGRTHQHLLELFRNVRGTVRNVHVPQHKHQLDSAIREAVVVGGGEAGGGDSSVLRYRSHGYACTDENSSAAGRGLGYADQLPLRNQLLPLCLWVQWATGQRWGQRGERSATRYTRRSSCDRSQRAARGQAASVDGTFPIYLGMVACP
jgi:hypothetical protein